MPGVRSKSLKILGVLAVVVVLLGVAGYVVYQRTMPRVLGSHCAITGAHTKDMLTLDQAANAATIAGVAYSKHLPRRAVVIAYATALQESKLHNLGSGDRDSVGLFQQRPSQGWGTRAELHDPVYASRSFYHGLNKVRDYLDLPLQEAAQRVQRSADGGAYAEHIPEAELLTAAFTGFRPHAVRCWYPNANRARQPTATELERTFGRVSISGHDVTTSSPQIAWAVAAWAVAHAHGYGLHSVEHSGLIWRADHGHDGWQHDDAGDPSGYTVVIR